MNILFLLFIVIPVLEMTILIQVGSWLGVMPTIACVLATAFIGVNLLRIQGTSTLFRFNQKLSQGNLPVQEIADGMMLAFAGALLLTPGFVTDAFGFALLMPFVRVMIARALVARMQTQQASSYSSTQFGSGYGPSRYSSESENTYEGEYEAYDDQPPPKTDAIESDKPSDPSR